MADACRLAVEVARQGERADLAIPAPGPMRPVLSFVRLSAPALGTVARVVDDDDAFRARVADAAGAADDTELGRAGWLWLHRPKGWADDPALADGPGAPDGANEARSQARLRRERENAEAAATRERRRADAAEAAQQRITGRLADARSQASDAERALEALRGDRDRLDRERNQAVRDLKAVEAQLAGTRHELKLARAATVQAEAELLAERRRRSTDGAVDPAVVGDAVAAAARSAVALGESLAEAASALGGSGSGPDEDTGGGQRGDGSTAVTPGRDGTPGATPTDRTTSSDGSVPSARRRRQVGS